MKTGRAGWLRVSLLFAFIFLIVLLVFTIKLPGASDGIDAQVQLSELLHTDSEWIVQYTITNPEVEANGYRIQVTGDINQYQETMVIPGGKSFVFVYHARPDTTGDGKTEFIVYKDGVTAPLDRQTYYFKESEL